MHEGRRSGGSGFISMPIRHKHFHDARRASHNARGSKPAGSLPKLAFWWRSAPDGPLKGTLQTFSLASARGN